MRREFHLKVLTLREVRWTDEFYETPDGYRSLTLGLVSGTGPDKRSDTDRDT